jgi:hypothetical protein
MKLQDFVTKTLANKLQEIGFDEACFFIYRKGTDLYLTSSDGHYKDVFEQARSANFIGGIPAPTYAQAFRWFREQFQLNVEIRYNERNRGYNPFFSRENLNITQSDFVEMSYDKAQEYAIEKAIEITKIFEIPRTEITSLFELINKMLNKSGYLQISFDDALLLGLNENTKESEIELLLLKNGYFIED